MNGLLSQYFYLYFFKVIMLHVPPLKLKFTSPDIEDVLFAT